MSHKKPILKVPWYYGPTFLLFWLVLFLGACIPVFFHLPDSLNIANENSNPGEFIAERAQRILYDFDLIGPKVVGSFANENLTVQLLHDEITKIRQVMHDDLFELELDVQVVSGAYMRSTVMSVYQGVQNFAVKFSSRSSTSESYLLINSHFDSKPGSPGTGDDGAMLVIMLEILRVLATTRQTFQHPIIFLFNGAEENGLQASHGFITQHKWAKNCKALINLDSAGSGNREILFQSGPNHPWLMKYYNKYIKRPYATTFAEEIFQAGLLPSDTDFRIFRDFGHVPGLDFAHSYNGYVYHTRFDKFDVIPRGTLQVTGDNILALTRAFADAPELEDSSKYAEGHTVFYDFLGLFLVYYTETQGIIINMCIAVGTFVVVGVSLWLIASASYMSIWHVTRHFLLIFGLHFIGLVLAFGLPLLMAVLYDSGNRSMTWFTHKWLVIGLYICPCLFGLSAPTLLYLSLNRNDKISKPFQLQMILHSQSIILALLCIAGTSNGIRSSYFLMISLFFYVCSLILNMISTLHGRDYYWTIFVKLSQIMPFLYFTYLFHALLCTIIPMQGRSGSAINPDLLIALFCSFGTVLSMGFLIPLLNIFRRAKMIIASLLVITFIFAMMALTPLGFPYRPKTHVHRTNFLHVRRIFYEYDGMVSRNESGYYFDVQDRRLHYPLESTVDLTGLRQISDDCDKYMMCGLPVFNYRWYNSRKQGQWLPSQEPIELPGTPTLTLLHKTIDVATANVRYEFELKGPPHMSIFLQPMENVTVKDWSFIRDMLEQPNDWQPPYHIFFSYGKDSTPLRFHFDFMVPSGQFDVPLFEIGISAHYISYEYQRGASGERFINSFPDYSFAMEWPSSYERYIF